MRHLCLLSRPGGVPSPLYLPFSPPLPVDPCKQGSSIEFLSSPAPEWQQRLAATLNKCLSKVTQAERTSAQQQWRGGCGDITVTNCVSHTSPPRLDVDNAAVTVAANGGLICWCVLYCWRCQEKFEEGAFETKHFVAVEKLSGDALTLRMTGPM